MNAEGHGMYPEVAPVPDLAVLSGTCVTNSSLASSLCKAETHKVLATGISA